MSTLRIEFSGSTTVWRPRGPARLRGQLSKCGFRFDATSIRGHFTRLCVGTNTNDPTKSTPKRSPRSHTIPCIIRIYTYVCFFLASVSRVYHIHKGDDRDKPFCLKAPLVRSVYEMTEIPPRASSSPVRLHGRTRQYVRTQVRGTRKYTARLYIYYEDPKPYTTVSCIFIASEQRRNVPFSSRPISISTRPRSEHAYVYRTF